MLRQAEFKVGEEDQDPYHHYGEEKDNPGLQPQGPLEYRGPSPMKIYDLFPDLADHRHGLETKKLSNSGLYAVLASFQRETHSPRAP
jgi:hypothetical protein